MKYAIFCYCWRLIFIHICVNFICLISDSNIEWTSFVQRTTLRSKILFFFYKKTSFFIVMELAEKKRGKKKPRPPTGFMLFARENYGGCDKDAVERADGPWRKLGETEAGRAEQDE